MNASEWGWQLTKSGQHCVAKAAITGIHRIVPLSIKDQFEIVKEAWTVSTGNCLV